MRAKLANLNDCALPFLRRAAANLCWYNYTSNLISNQVKLLRRKVTNSQVTTPRKLSQLETESEKPAYENTFDDYLEMFIQMGYVILFSAAYPLAAFWALLNNVLEIRVDGFKLVIVVIIPMPGDTSIHFNIIISLGKRYSTTLHQKSRKHRFLARCI